MVYGWDQPTRVFWLFIITAVHRSFPLNFAVIRKRDISLRWGATCVNCFELSNRPRWLYYCHKYGSLQRNRNLFSKKPTFPPWADFLPYIFCTLHARILDTVMQFIARVNRMVCCNSMHVPDRVFRTRNC